MCFVPQLANTECPLSIPCQHHSPIICLRSIAAAVRGALLQFWSWSSCQCVCVCLPTVAVLDAASAAAAIMRLLSSAVIAFAYC